MTDTIDVAALASVLTTTAKQLQRQADNASFVAEGFIRVIDPPYLIEMLSGAATALQSQEDALAEARRELSLTTIEYDNAKDGREYWHDCATTAESSLATMREALEEIAHSAETHSHVIVIARAALAREGK